MTGRIWLPITVAMIWPWALVRSWGVIGCTCSAGLPPPDWLEGPAELGISGIVPIIYKGGKEEMKSAGRFLKEDGGERANATGGIALNDLCRCESFFVFWLFVCDRKQSMSRSLRHIMRLIRVGLCVILRERNAQVSTDHLSLRWFYRPEQVKPKQTAGSALQRSVLNTCVCDGAHHWLCYPSPGQDWDEYVCMCDCVSECVCA